MPRKIQAPGVEVNEMDRSSYGQKQDYALPNAPAMLITGFADKGPDYVIQWINSPETLVQTYGYPTNEAEKYFYNAQLEVLGRGGYCITAKLPYFNKSKDKYVYTGYTVDVDNAKKIPDILSELGSHESNLIGKNIYDFLLFPNIEPDYLLKSQIIAKTYSYATPVDYQNDVKQYYMNSLQEVVDVDTDAINTLNDIIQTISKLYETALPDQAIPISNIVNDVVQQLVDLLNAKQDDVVYTVDGMKNLGDVVDAIKNNLNLFGLYIAQRPLSQIFEEKNINLKIIDDFIMFVDNMYDFEFEAKRAFNSLFYDDVDKINPNALYLLKEICDNTPIEQIKEKFNSDEDRLNAIQRYQAEILSMQNTIRMNTDIDGFSSLKTLFAQQNGVEYFVNYFNSLKDEVTSIEHPDSDILLEALLSFDMSNVNKTPLMLLKQLDSSMSSYCEIHSNPFEENGKMSFEEYDRYTTNELKPKQNQFYIVDKTRSKYTKVDVLSGDYASTKLHFHGKEILGIVPVVTTPINAMFFQQLISTSNPSDVVEFNPVSALMTLPSAYKQQFVIDNIEKTIDDQNFSVKLCSDEIEFLTMSKTASMLFPTITMRNENCLDRKYLKQIGVVVLQAFEDHANNNKISFNVLESFVGSLDKDAVDDDTKAGIYIGDIINGQSKYISFFSNVQFNQCDCCQFDTYFIQNQTATSLGFYSNECEKDISYAESISNPLNIILDHAKNSYELPLDAVIDAGVSNIAQFIQSTYPKTGYGKYTFNNVNMIPLKTLSSKNVGAWKQTLMKFDNFCKDTRMCKDCMFIADGPRHFGLYGNAKRVRPSDIKSSFMRDVFPGLKCMQVLDTSYGAGYCNWYLSQDLYTGDPIWLPPSIKAAGVFIYTDTYFHPWDAPAGINRATLTNVFDVAFNPTIQEAGKIYNYQWNYAISYPIDGIVIEGQKTFQRNKTALDRINVRRLMLYLEKQVVRIGRHFLYEGNTEYLRQRFVDALTPIFEDCENGYGIQEFAIKCDEENNTEETIENNELHVKIAVKPIKTLEFLVCDFIVTNQSASVSEEVLQ